MNAQVWGTEGRAGAALALQRSFNSGRDLAKIFVVFSEPFNISVKCSKFELAEL